MTTNGNGAAPRFTSRAEYDAIAAVNWTTLKEMRRSPLHYRHRCENPAAETAPMRLGRAVHVAVLEPERFVSDYVVFEGERRAGKVWEAFEAAATGASKEILKASEHAECCEIATAVRTHPLAAKYLAEGRAEQTIVWTDPETKLPCKGRVDWLCDVPGFAALVDLKTTAELDAYRLGATIARLGHHCQIAFYARGLRALGLMQDSKLIVVESEAPYDVALFGVAGDILTAGDEEVGQLLRRVAECRGRGEWPGRYDAIEQELRLPAWLYRDAEDAEGLGLLMGGQEA